MIAKPLRYKPLRADEQLLADTVCHAVLTDPDIMAQLAKHHDVGDRCSCVVVTDRRGEFQDGYVADELATNKRFPFAAVRQTISSYDPADSICLILVRGRDVSVSMTGLISGGDDSDDQLH